jgi:hypothetical protein
MQAKRCIQEMSGVSDGVRMLSAFHKISTQEEVLVKSLIARDLMELKNSGQLSHIDM